MQLFLEDRPGRIVAFSKFDPYREQPEENAFGATTKSGARRARILRWVNWLVLVYTAIGFGLIAYWLVRG